MASCQKPYSSSLVKQFIMVHDLPSWLLKTNEQLSSKTLVVVIPGNPGIIDYYSEFQQALYEASNCTVDVWGLSHIGHMTPPDNAECSHGAIYDVEDQINHKIAFLEDHIPPGVNLILIGHSIGCYIILEILKRKPDLPIHKALLLFPTIERMAESPNGIVATPLTLYFRWFFYIVSYLSFLFPDWMKELLVSSHLDKKKLGQTAITASLELFNPHCLNNVIYMAGQEMLQVTERDNDTINQNINKLIFYHGQTDGWCPMEYYEDMKTDFPDGNIRLDLLGMAHAFCLESSTKMAEVVWDWIKENV